MIVDTMETEIPIPLVIIQEYPPIEINNSSRTIGFTKLLLCLVVLSCTIYAPSVRVNPPPPKAAKSAA